MRRLVVRDVPLLPRRHHAHRLVEHRRAVEREQLDLLVHVVDGHVVHPLEVRHRRVDQLEPDGGALAPRVGRTRRDRVALGLREHRLEALPVGERTHRRVGGHEVVQVRRAGARLTDDEDRPLDGRVEDLGVGRAAGPRAAAGSSATTRFRPCALDASHRRAPGLAVERVEEHRERLAEPVVAEVVEPGLGARLRGERASGVSSSAAAMGTTASRIACTSGVNCGSARSSMWIGRRDARSRPAAWHTRLRARQSGSVRGHRTGATVGSEWGIGSHRRAAGVRTRHAVPGR